MFFIKAFWVSLVLILMTIFLVLGIYGIPVLQVSTQKTMGLETVKSSARTYPFL